MSCLKKPKSGSESLTLRRSSGIQGASAMKRFSSTSQIWKRNVKTWGSYKKNVTDWNRSWTNLKATTRLYKRNFARCKPGIRVTATKERLEKCLSCFYLLERFSSDLEMKTREQNKNNKRTEIERFDWFIERLQTHLAFGWLSERSAEKTSCPKNFLEIALTSYCNTIGQSNNAFSILGFSLAGKRRVHFLFFSSIGW